ncbi:MAG: hypothetical protein ACI977_000549 [Candidatus Nanohaloarchaea archaeon]|jgi:hypothetical protein
MGIKLWMVFEAISNQEDAVRESMDEHIQGLRDEKDLKVIEANFDEVSEMKNPHPDIDQGYSHVVEVSVECETFERAVRTVVNYGPTYVQVEGPDSFELDLKDSQESLQFMANTMQSYAEMGAGGVLISRGNEE